MRILILGTFWLVGPSALAHMNFSDFFGAGVWNPQAAMTSSTENQICQTRGETIAVQAGGSYIGANLNLCDLDDAQLMNTNFSNSLLRHVSFRSANLTGALFRATDQAVGADLTGVDFSRANLMRADFSGPVIGANLTNARFFSNMNFSQVNFSNAFLRQTLFDSVTLDKCDMRGAHLDGTIFIDVSFIECQMQNQNFSKTRMRGVRFESSQLSGASLAGLNLPRVRIDNCHCEGVDFRGADLFHGSLVSSQLRNANFTGTNISRAQLMWSDLRGANLSTARFGAIGTRDQAYFNRAIYDDQTKFPQGFDPGKAGMVRADRTYLRQP